MESSLMTEQDILRGILMAIVESENPDSWGRSIVTSTTEAKILRDNIFAWLRDNEVLRSDDS
jgi:hypothetical protein